MENELFIKIDEILKNVRKNESFTIEDILKICQHPMYTIADKFKISLNSYEQKKLANLEKANLWTIGRIAYNILITDDPYNYVNMSERKKYELDKSYYKYKNVDDNILDINIYRKKIAFKYIYLEKFTKKKATFTGKVPKQGFFYTRQIIADEWLQDFINIIERTLNHAFHYAKNNLDYISFPHLYIIAYLLKYYHEDFDIKPKKNKLEYYLAAIPKFFYNVEVAKMAKKVYQS